MFNQLPNALTALAKAVVAAQVAVEEAAREGEPVSGVAARLNQVEVAGGQVVRAGRRRGGERVGRPPRRHPPGHPGRRGADPGRAAAAGPDPRRGDPDPHHLGRPARPRAGPDQPRHAPAGPDPGAADHRGAAAHHDHDAADHRSAHHRPPPTTESTATPGSAGGGDTGAAERTPAEDVPPTTPEVPAP